MGFRLSLARMRSAIARCFFGGKTAPIVAVASPPAAPVTVPVPPEVTPEVTPEITPELPREVTAEVPAEVTELLPVPERHDTPRFEDAPVAPAAIVAAPDPDAERLLARCARLQAQMLDFTGRLADMEQQVRSYEQHQFLALGDVVGECLRLRQEYLRLKAARSGIAADAEKARQADADFDAYRRSTEHTPAPLPELDDDEQDELRRLYRAAAMRCHPDRAEEAERAEAHDVFLRVQAAYQARDLEGLRGITAELAGWVRESDEASPAQASTAPAGSAVRRRVAELQTQVADLMLAVQTLQLDPAYRRAVQVERWEADFADARAGFEAECEALREQIARLA